MEFHTRLLVTFIFTVFCFIFTLLLGIIASFIMWDMGFYRYLMMDNLDVVLRASLVVGLITYIAGGFMDD